MILLAFRRGFKQCYAETTSTASLKGFTKVAAKFQILSECDPNEWFKSNATVPYNPCDQITRGLLIDISEK